MSKAYEEMKVKVPLEIQIKVLEDLAAIDQKEIERLNKELKKVNVTLGNVSVSFCKIGAYKDGYCENYRNEADCMGCDFKGKINER